MLSFLPICCVAFAFASLPVIAIAADPLIHPVCALPSASYPALPNHDFPFSKPILPNQSDPSPILTSRSLSGAYPILCCLAGAVLAKPVFSVTALPTSTAFRSLHFLCCVATSAAFRYCRASPLRFPSKPGGAHPAVPLSLHASRRVAYPVLPFL